MVSISRARGRRGRQVALEKRQTHCSGSDADRRVRLALWRPPAGRGPVVRRGSGSGAEPARHAHSLRRPWAFRSIGRPPLFRLIARTGHQPDGSNDGPRLGLTDHVVHRERGNGRGSQRFHLHAAGTYRRGLGTNAARASGPVRIRTETATIGPGGVEMEALTAAAVAALTVYDLSLIHISEPTRPY